MQTASTLLPQSAARANRRTFAELADCFGASRSQVEEAYLNSRTVYEVTTPKKRNPSQSRVMSLLSHKQKDFNRLLKRSLYRQCIHPAVHGYVRGRSIWTNLAVHFEGSRVDEPLAWYGFDIADAFPAVSHRWVSRIISSTYPELSKAARAVMVNLLCFRGRLDQGYPTSPVLFNLALYPLDAALQDYCEPRGIVYSRYADDFHFSATRDFSEQEKTELVRLAERHPFRFRIIKQKESKLGEPFQVTHRSTERFRRRLKRDRDRGLTLAQTLVNLQAKRD